MKSPFFCFAASADPDFPGNILAVNLVDEIFQRNQITVRARWAGVEAVVDGNKNETPRNGKNSLQIVAGFLVVSAKSGTGL